MAAKPINKEAMKQRAVGTCVAGSRCREVDMRCDFGFPVLWFSHSNGLVTISYYYYKHRNNNFPLCYVNRLPWYCSIVSAAMLLMVVKLITTCAVGISNAEDRYIQADAGRSENARSTLKRISLSKEQKPWQQCNQFASLGDCYRLPVRGTRCMRTASLCLCSCVINKLLNSA